MQRRHKLIRAVLPRHLQGQKGALSGELVADAVTNGDYSRLALGVRAPLRVQQLASGQYRGVCEPPVRDPSHWPAWTEAQWLLPLMVVAAWSQAQRCSAALLDASSACSCFANSGLGSHVLQRGPSIMLTDHDGRF